MVIYLEGKHGIRTVYTEAEAVQSEAEGYKRIDLSNGWPKPAAKKSVKRRVKK